MKKRMMTASLAVLIGLVSMTSCKKQQPQMVATPHKTMTVETQSRELSTNYSATIRGRQDIEIYPQVGGTLQKLCVTEGQRVKKGQILFIIDQVPYKAALTTAEANVKAAEAALATAQLNYDSRKRLYDQQVVSDFDLRKAENDLLSAKAALEQAKAQRINAANNLSYTTVMSPADGVVGTLPYRQGALVGSSMPQPLTTVSDNDEMYVYFSMNETSLLEMIREYGSPEEAIKKMPSIQLQLSDGSILPDSGRVESISGVIDRTTGSVTLRAAFPNKNHLLHAGSSGNVIIPTYYNNCIVIPQEATVELQDKVLVYKVVDGKAKSTQITVAPINDGREYIVLDGLKQGETIIAEGAGLVREGTPVGQASTDTNDKQK